MSDQPAAQQIHAHPEAFSVVIRTPAGQPGTFEVRADEHVEKVVHEAVTYFAKHGELAQGEYELVLVHDGQGEVLVGSARLEDYDISSTSQLHLQVKPAPIDGN